MNRQYIRGEAWKKGTGRMPAQLRDVAKNQLTRKYVDFDSPSRFMALMDTQLGMFEAVENFVGVCIGDAVSATERDWTRMVTVRRVMA